MHERSIFLAALDIPDPQERARYLHEACGENAALRRHIDELIAAEAKLSSFLKAPAAELDATAAQLALTERPGSQIGPYKLVQTIGEGGMGVVYMAQQTSPVKRLVALKIIKPGMDTRQVIARFEAERQTLALMDHPNIAKVLDAAAMNRLTSSFGMFDAVVLTDVGGDQAVATSVVTNCHPLAAAPAHHQPLEQDFRPADLGGGRRLASALLLAGAADAFETAAR